MKKLILAAAILALLVPVAAFAVEDGSWTGEVLDMGCYAKGQSGAGHATCAQKCLNGGSAMGLLTSDGAVVLVSKESDADAYKTLQGLGGAVAKVEGTSEQVDGKTTVTVKSAAKSE